MRSTVHEAIHPKMIAMRRTQSRHDLSLATIVLVSAASASNLLDVRGGVLSSSKYAACRLYSFSASFGTSPNAKEMPPSLESSCTIVRLGEE